MTDYKTIFRQATKIVWDSSKYEIHHIDKNHNNNDIKNLIPVPKELHQNYHQCAYSANKIVGYQEFNERNLNPLQGTQKDYDSLIEFLYLKQEMICFRDIKYLVLKGIIQLEEETDYDELVKKTFPNLYEKYSK